MFSEFIKSTILSKVVVAVTGAMITGFLVAHIAGNLLMYIGAEAFNSYAHNLSNMPVLVWGNRIALLIALILHTFATIRLVMYNKQSKPVGYKSPTYTKSTFSSRNMIFMGFVLLFFAIYHILHFTAGVIDPATFKSNLEFTLANGEKAHDAYRMAILGFQNPLIAVFYVIAMISLGLHLNHGVSSLFQTLGIYGDKFTKNAKKIGSTFAIILVALFSSIPIAVMLKILK